MFFNYLHLVNCNFNISSSSKQTAADLNELLLLFICNEGISGKTFSFDVRMKEKKCHKWEEAACLRGK